VNIPFSLRDVTAWARGSIVRGDAEVSLSGVSIDTRTLRPGQLYVAIRGEQHDGHRFVAQALEAGAGGLLVDQTRLDEGRLEGDGPVVVVDDTTAALGALAAGHRGGFEGPRVAITGSNGKTTTKEMCHAILSVAAPCLKNQGNLNNEFGLPLTLLSRQAEQRSAVVELGMNHRGEIARLAAIARPDVGVITNVGTAHIEFLGSQEAIAEEKGDLTAALHAEGTAVLNHDDERVASQAGRAAGGVISYGRAPGADVSARGVRFVSGGAFEFVLVTPSGSLPVRVRGLAETTVINALAAATAALAAGASLEDVATGLGRHDHVAGRMACLTLRGGAQLIDDTYNANPQSMQNALESLARLKGEGRSVAVLGDMGELGELADQAHHEAGRLAASLGTDFLFALGQRSEQVAEGARDAGMSADRISCGTDHQEVSRAIAKLLGPRDWVLVKGSRAMRMERVVEALAAEE